MIKTIFPVNIFVKDIEKADEWSDELKNISNAIFLNYLSEKNISREVVTENEIPFFTEDNLKKYPIVEELKQLFIDGFYSLAQSYTNNTLTRQKIEEMVCKNTGRLPFMKKNDYKSTHTHIGSSAYAVFYLSDIDNEKYGGKLVLRDPSFNTNSCFKPLEKYEIETKKNRLIIAPGYVWHEVTPYFGDEERITIVINLDFF